MADPVAERVAALVQPALDAAGVSLYDLEHAGGTLRVVVQRPGGVDLDTVAAVTRAVSRLLDEADPVAGQYTLEVSSPGLERRLRTPAHFAGAVGETIRLKLRPGAAERRVSGVVVGVDDDAVLIRAARPEGGGGTTELRVELADIQQARTVFEWEATPKPGQPGASRSSRPDREKKAAS